MSRYCVHDDTPETCPPCQRGSSAVAPRRTSARLGPPFSARYEGRCAGCGEDVLIGDAVRMVSGAVTHTHEECVEEALA